MQEKWQFFPVSFGRVKDDFKSISALAKFDQHEAIYAFSKPWNMRFSWLTFKDKVFI